MKVVSKISQTNDLKILVETQQSATLTSIVLVKVKKKMLVYKRGQGEKT